jgi:HAD superfamily hydrolase (TIGR01459 family)
MKAMFNAYDSFIIDLWGVMHDGTMLYPGAAEALAAIHASGKPVIFLSNAPRRAEKAQATLDRLGVPRAHYQRIITSGEVAFAWLRDHTAYGPNYYYLGPSKDEDVLAALDGYCQVASADKANFVLNTGYEFDFQPHEAILPTLRNLHAARLPLVCINPDLEVVKQDGTVMLCAGSVAAAYDALGGEVTYVGKPHANAYEAALHALPKGANPLCIGDNPLTDIKGANAAGLDSLLVAGGVLKTAHGITDVEAARDACIKAGATPTHVIGSFSL